MLSRSSIVGFLLFALSGCSATSAPPSSSSDAGVPPLALLPPDCDAPLPSALLVDPVTMEHWNTASIRASGSTVYFQALPSFTGTPPGIYSVEVPNGAPRLVALAPLEPQRVAASPADPRAPNGDAGAPDGDAGAPSDPEIPANSALYFDEFWIDGDSIVGVNGLRQFRAPVRGGTFTPLPVSGVPANGFDSAYARLGDSLYAAWRESNGRRITVLREPWGGGAVTSVAAIETANSAAVWRFLAGPHGFFADLLDTGASRRTTASPALWSIPIGAPFATAFPGDVLLGADDAPFVLRNASYDSGAPARLWHGDTTEAVAGGFAFPSAVRFRETSEVQTSRGPVVRYQGAAYIVLQERFQLPDTSTVSRDVLYRIRPDASGMDRARCLPEAAQFFGSEDVVRLDVVEGSDAGIFVVRSRYSASSNPQDVPLTEIVKAWP